MATISETRPAAAVDDAKAATTSAVEVPASTAQQDALEHYGWPPPTKPAQRRVITLRD
jgi:hypothetical protein